MSSFSEAFKPCRIANRAYQDIIVGRTVHCATELVVCKLYQPTAAAGSNEYLLEAAQI